MQDQPFREPVLLYWQHPDGRVRPTLIQSTREAFTTLTRGDHLPVNSAEYQVAFDKIVRALLDPMPEKIEEARGALNRLANALAGQDVRRTLH
jgi:hypothetical protein